MSRHLVRVLGSICLLALLVSPALSQEAKPKKKAAGRLPAHYKDVVTPEQRTKIYGIQSKYAQQILQLAEQMKMLTAQRDAEIEGVLSAEQKQKVESLKAEASKKRGAPAEPESTTDAGEAKAAPAAPAKSASK